MFRFRKKITDFSNVSQVSEHTPLLNTAQNNYDAASDKKEDKSSSATGQKIKAAVNKFFMTGDISLYIAASMWIERKIQELGLFPEHEIRLMEIYLPYLSQKLPKGRDEPLSIKELFEIINLAITVLNQELDPKKQIPIIQIITVPTGNPSSIFAAAGSKIATTLPEAKRTALPADKSVVNRNQKDIDALEELRQQLQNKNGGLQNLKGP